MSRWLGCVAGALLFYCLLLSPWQTNFPPVGPRLALQIVFPPGVPGQCEPLITTGATDDGDFLAVRYLDAENAVLLYDVWGVGGPQSVPFPLRAGARRQLEIEMPTLAHVPQAAPHEKRPLRVTLDGVTLLDGPVYFHRRQPAEIFFALNPIGGTLAKEAFRGTLTLRDGHVLRGGPESRFSPFARTLWLLRSHPIAIVARLALAVAFGWLVAWLLPWCGRGLLRSLRRESEPAIFPTRANPPHAWFVATAALCAVVFIATITGGTFQLIYPEEFGHFYDYQALSLLHGQLDLPAAAHSSESFVFNGRHYIYFGPTPAVLRLPFVFFHIGIGQLSRCYMVGYYLALLAAVYAVLLHVHRVASAAQSWPSRFSVVVLVANAGLGTALFFLGSRAYIYHEAILCGAMFALWSGYFSLRYLSGPRTRTWVLALALGVAAIQARPSTGLFALSLLAGVAAIVGIREMVTSHSAGKKSVSAWRTLRGPLLVITLAGVGVLSFNGMSYLKFRTFEGMPLRYNVQYGSERLARFDARNFHLTNIPFNVGTYLWRPAFELRASFPFFYVKGVNTADFPQVKSDLAELTVAMPYTMPATILLACVGGALACAVWPGARLPLLALAVAALPMSLALFSAVVVSQRYTADFCPALLLAAAFGLQAGELLQPVWRRVAVGLVVLLSLVSIFNTLAITLHYEGEVVWGVPDDVRARYQGLRKTVDGLLGVAANE